MNKFLTTIKPYFFEFLSAVMAGVCISIGGIAFLCSPSKAVGAIFFCVGLFLVLLFDFSLFTGRICFALDKKPVYLINLILIWLGNFCGTLIAGSALLLTRLINIQEACIDICSTKLADSFLSLFVLGIFCNILIFVAVYGYKKSDNPLIKILSLIFGVSVFVLCGFEHCVADMFYFAFARSYGGQQILRLLTVTAGNIVGGILMALVIKLKDKLAVQQNQNDKTVQDQSDKTNQNDKTNNDAK